MTPDIRDVNTRDFNTRDLVNTLAQAPRPPKPLSIAAALAGIFALSILVTAVTFGLRHHFYDDAEMMMLVRKILALGLFLLIAAQALDAMSSPVAKPSPRWPAFALALVGLYFIGQEWASHSPSEIFANFSPKYFFTCLAMVSLYGSGGAFLMAQVLKRHAPCDIDRASVLAGLAAAGAGALGYALHCPVDSATFITVSYGLPIGAVALVCRIFMPRAIRW